MTARRAWPRAGHVTVHKADVIALSFGDASFDAVTSYLMLHHVIAWRDALAEAGRVLRPGGAFIGYDLTDTRAARLTQGSPSFPPPDELRIGSLEAGFRVRRRSILLPATSCVSGRHRRWGPASPHA